MAGQYVKHTKQDSPKRAAPRTDDYDPFVRGRFPVGVRTIQALDTVRNRLFPCEIWYPAAAQHTGQDIAPGTRSEEHTSELQSPCNLVCRLLLEKKNKYQIAH